MEANPLITAEQIRRIAREQEMAVGVIEKDYAQSWLLRGFAETDEIGDSFVLKGGTAIRKIYFPKAWRFSEDLDFTVIGNKDANMIRKAMQSVLERLRDESGIKCLLESFHPTIGSIIANVQFTGPLSYSNRIRHDITLNENMVLMPERRTIVSDYPDLPSFEILAYPLAEILVEKIRSIMQRGYSRDYYDVWRLLKADVFQGSEVKSLLHQKCEVNAVSYQPELLFASDRLSEASSFWMTGLSHLTKELPNFDVVISELRAQLRFLQE